MCHATAFVRGAAGALRRSNSRRVEHFAKEARPVRTFWGFRVDKIEQLLSEEHRVGDGLLVGIDHGREFGLVDRVKASFCGGAMDRMIEKRLPKLHVTGARVRLTMMISGAK